VDATEASNALAEIQQRSEQTLRQGSPRKLPAWYVYGTAAALAAMLATDDLTGWTATGTKLAALLTLIGLTTALERVTGVRLRMRSLRWMPLALFIAAVLATFIGAGTLLRLYDVPADATIAGIAAAVVWAVTISRVNAAAIRNPA
jgi:hypothetical protein